ncbi:MULTISPECIES: sugar porter family MFS transporter [Stenotrophomonas]|uniref:sugar porter family MFS transporter n=1 Tax=Stenotrophomonas TaxID=40323 RepID=UPI001F3DEADC|nr:MULTISPECIES: sugar porter family MFS transporter [Stenotrophomonas maltophilia group]MCF3467449.1 sugar porter family MFS transporter [Stenotrophomonas maltophilia]MCF3491335.1 sugar porter family MFS transporter [Stenotrophomonas maltophilia]MCF3511379.1 sugar porter family MFS transporter [Stenotrophomonas maltophilia]MCF3526597.1 sugar porter family MFS transporter [Stenotrophomonas maltophilia]MCF3555766.1 sugar porter family MFS transporter [Stenotrophomonas maltophilia]
MSQTQPSTAPHGGENTAFIVLISCVATLGGFLFGFDSGVINGTVDGLRQAFNSSEAALGFEVASMLLGCAIGAFLAGWLGDRLGRRGVLIVSALMFLVSALGAGAAHASWLFIAARVLGGFAVGAASVMSPAYIAEVASARYRGRLATVQQMAIICGLFAAFLSNYLLARAAGASTEPLWLGHEAWRWMFWMQVLPSGLFLLLLLVIPESPRFLVLKGRQGQARAVLARLYGEAAATAKQAEIEASLAQDQHKPRFGDLRNKATGKLRPILWVGIGLAMFQQLVGINVVFYYGAVLWQAVGFSESDALLINVLSGALSIGACLLTVLLIDRIGRRPLLWIGSVGMSVALVLMVVAFASGSLADGRLQLSDGMGRLALVAANVYVVFFNMSWGPVMWVMLGEMFPNQIRGPALALAGAAQWTSNFAITVTFPMLLAGIGLAGAYGIYAVAAILSIVFVVRHVRETKGKELEQMEG